MLQANLQLMAHSWYKGANIHWLHKWPIGRIWWVRLFASLWSEQPFFVYHVHHLCLACGQKKHKMSTSSWHRRKSQKDQSLRTYPLRNLNVCIRFHGKPSNSCWDISVWASTVSRPTDQHYRPKAHAASTPKKVHSKQRQGAPFNNTRSYQI